MSDTPTPEMDAAELYYDGPTGFVPIEKAWEVEKQRNAAIDALEMIAYDCNNPRADYQAVADAALMDIENMRGELK